MIFGQPFALSTATLGSLISVCSNGYAFQIKPGWADTELSGNASYDGPGTDASFSGDNVNSRAGVNSPWNWGQYPIRVRVKERHGSISDIWVTGPDVYYFEKGFESVWVVPHGAAGVALRSANVCGRWNVTFATNPNDRIVSTPVQTSPIVVYTITGSGETGHIATDVAPTTTSQGVSLVRAVGFQILLRGDAAFTGGSVDLWFWDHSFGVWCKGSISYAIPTGQQYAVTPQEIVSVPAGRVYAAYNGATGPGSLTVGYTVSYATN